MTHRRALWKEQLVEALVSSKFHGLERISVVSSVECDYGVPLFITLVVPILKCHLGGHFHTHRPTVRKEHMVQPIGCYLNKPLGKPLSWRVTETTQHDVRHFLDLVNHGRRYFRMGIPMYNAPP